MILITCSTYLCATPYVNTKTGNKQPVPRHSEIDEHLAQHIVRYLGLEQ